MADVTIPTRDGQTVGGFVDEVCRAVEAKLTAMFAPAGSNLWASCERDTVDAGDAVGEVKGGDGECRYFRFRYSRDDRFNLVLSEPEPVVEVTTYEPAEPPALMSAVVSLDAVAAYAPPADGLTVGRRTKVLRLGPLHDVNTGDFVIDVTDELCAELVEASQLGFAVPIDVAHQLYNAQVSGKGEDAVTLYGRASKFEHVPGVGLYAVSEWTAGGAAKLQAEPGLHYFSPTIVGAAYSPADGQKKAKRRIHSLSLTPTPKQDGSEVVALASAPHAGHFINTCPGCGSVSQCRCMSPGKEKTNKPCTQCTGAPHAGGTRPKEVAMSAPIVDPAVKPGDNVITLSASDHAVLLAAKARVVELEETVKAKDSETVALSQRLTALETERAVDKARAEVKAARDAGKVIGPDDEVKILALAPDVRAFALSLVPATRPMVEIGHGGKVEDDPVKRQVAEVNAELDGLRSKK